MDLCFKSGDNSWKYSCFNSGGIVYLNSSIYSNSNCAGLPSHTKIAESYEEGASCSPNGAFACQEAEDDRGTRIGDLFYAEDCSSPNVGFLRSDNIDFCSENDNSTDSCVEGTRYCPSSWMVAIEYRSCVFHQSYNLDTSTCIPEQDASWRYSCSESNGQVTLSKFAYESANCLGEVAEISTVFTVENEACSANQKTVIFSCQQVEEVAGVVVGKLYEGGDCSGIAIGSLRKEADTEYGLCEPTKCLKNELRVDDLFQCSIDQCSSTISSLASNQAISALVALSALGAFFI